MMDGGFERRPHRRALVRSVWIACVITLGWAFGASSGFAEEPAAKASAPAGSSGVAPYQFGNEVRAHLLGGLSGGGSFGSAGGGGFVGGELSLAWIKNMWWGGLYVDGVYDFGQDAGTFTFGPEVGYAVLGLDGGLGVRLGREDSPELGYNGRLLITAGVFAIYGRYGYWPDSDTARHTGQVGVLLKFPLWSEGPLPAIAR